MKIEFLKEHYQNIIDCSIKDESGLNDFQKLPLQNALEIPRVGIERFRLPLTFMHADGSSMSHDCEASMFVFLKKGKTGVNMSRFCSILQEASLNMPVGKAFFKTVLERFRLELRDYSHEEAIPEAQLKIKFRYPIKQASLKSENWGWQYYDAEWDVVQNSKGELFPKLTINYEYSSTCPCSLSMAKQYEEGYRQGITTEGNGIATAHGQRSNARCTVLFGERPDAAWLRIEELVGLLRKAIPTETQSLVKRIDEQAFAILNGEHPMFVEHACRWLSLVLNEEKRIKDWQVKVEHFESLHSHNAVAYIAKEKQ